MKHLNFKKILATTTLAALALYLVPGVSAATLTSGSASLSDARPGTASTTYTMTFSNVTLTSTKCIQVVFSNAATGGVIPTNMVTSGVTLGASSNYMPTPASWAATSATPGTVKVTFATGETPASATGRTLVLNGITNGTVADTSYFAQFSTYSDTACTTPIDSGIATFIYTNGQAVSMSVDPTIAFTVGSVAGSTSVNGATTTVATTATTIPFGTVTSGANAIAAHLLTVTTNAGAGYTVYARYTAAPTNGSHQITDWTGTNAAPTTFSAAGTEAFGYTTTSTSLSGTAARFASNKWAGFTTANLEVAHSTAAVSASTTTLAYQVGIAGTTPAGSYTSTVILTATPSY
jgi:hypothetical protein